MHSERQAQALQSIEMHAAEARFFVDGMTREQFRADRRTFHAVTRCLEIISEATRRLADELKARHPDLPWRDIADAGNVYRHDYDNVAADFIYKTVTQDLANILAMARIEIERLSPRGSGKAGGGRREGRMTRLFAVLRDYGPGFVSGQPLEAQPKWSAHARFMDDLETEGAVLLAGPLGDAEEALLIMRGDDAARIERRLADDPWTASGVLVTRRIAPWTLRIGSLN